MSSAFFCPISLEVMKNPVILGSTGQSYEKEVIELWLRDNDTDPLSNVVLLPEEKVLIPNIALRNLIQENSSSNYIPAPATIEMKQIKKPKKMQPASKQSKARAKNVQTKNKFSPNRQHIPIICVAFVLFGTILLHFSWVGRSSRTADTTGSDKQFVMLDHLSLEFHDGALYNGTILNGKPHGYGQFKYNDGSTYNGEMKFGFRSGFGELLMVDGTRYTGPWLKDLLHGDNCVIDFPDGNVYKGRMKNFKRDGYGTLSFSDGSIYSGTFLNDVFHGHGKLIMNDFHYIGDFRNGKKNGYGVLLWSNKKYYEGNFIDDQPQGKGTYILKDGTILSGVFAIKSTVPVLQS